MRRSTVRPLLTGSLLALVAASLFGMLGPLSRIADDAGVGPIGFVAWRAGIGAAALAIGMALGGALPLAARSLRSLDRATGGALALAALTGYALNLAIFIAFGRITIALALMLFYTYPALVATTEVAMGRESLTRSRGLALALALLGVVLVLFGGLGEGGLTLDLLGVALACSAAISQTIFIIISRHGYARVPADAATLVILVTSAVGAVLTAVAVGAADELAAPFASPQAWPIILVAGILAAAVASYLFVTSIRAIGGTRTGILMLWEPVVGVILAALVLAEPLVPVQVAGGALVLGAALLLQLSTEPELEPVAPPVEIV